MVGVNEKEARVVRTGRSTSTTRFDPAVTEAPSKGKPMTTLCANETVAHKKAIGSACMSFILFSEYDGRGIGRLSALTSDIGIVYIPQDQK